MIQTSSKISFTHSVQFEIYIWLSFSSIFEKISAIYQIDLEFMYFNPVSFKRIFLFSNSQICS